MKGLIFLLGLIPLIGGLVAVVIRSEILALVMIADAIIFGCWYIGTREG